MTDVHRTRAAGRWVAALALLLAARPAAASLQPAPSGAAPTVDTLALVLDELRKLRLAVEQSTLLTVRVQITLQRLTLQDEQVRMLTDQATQLEAGVASTVVGLEHTRQDLARVEDQLGQERDPQMRRNLAEQKRALEETIERDTAQELDFRRRANETQAQLAEARGKLDELTRALEDIERGLPPPARGRLGGAPEPARPR
jgi:hypothetical protein